MENNNYDYRMFFIVIAIWTMLGAMAQCESVHKLYDIDRKVNNIRHELSMLSYNK